jgi:thioredoxin 2
MDGSGNTAIVTCGACGQRNRAALDKPGAAVCGRCKRNLGLGRVAEVTDATFRREVVESALPVLLDCWAPWCAPCRAVAPVIEDLATQLAGRVKFAKLNTDENQDVASRFNISSIPTLLLVRDGEVFGRIVGAQPGHAILGELRRVGFV